jgi:uncharacterized membrane protein
MIVKNRKWLLLVSISAIIAFMIVFFFNVYEMQDYENFSRFQRGSRMAAIPISYRMLLSPVLITIAAIFITYYFISRRLEEKLEKNMKIISKIISKNNHVPKKETDSRDIVLKFLNAGERKVLEMLIERKDAVLQSEISRMDGMTKLKTHRAVKDLERKGIIKTESFGKTNRITLSKDIKEVMLK